MSSVTRAVARIKVTNRNANRDLFRYIRLPVGLVKVRCPCYSEPYSDTVIETDLSMYDPHELLDWLWSTRRIKVPVSEIKPLAFAAYACVCFARPRVLKFALVSGSTGSIGAR